MACLRIEVEHLHHLWFVSQLLKSLQVSCQRYAVTGYVYDRFGRPGDYCFDYLGIQTSSWRIYD